jgi:histidyl-tRNA synthetase
MTNVRTPAVGAVVVLKNQKAPVRSPRINVEVPTVYVVQLGFGPKVRTLMLIDTLRQAGVRVHHDLASNSLSTQLRDAENRGVAYSVIIGQKEFVEGTFIFRDMAARNQEYVDLETLVKKLKRRSVVSA